MPQSPSDKVRSITEGRHRRDPQSSSLPQQEQPPDQKPPTSVHPLDTEDHATGTNGPNQNETLRHNVESGQAHQHPETPAGQHATGSFTTGAEAKNAKR